MKKLGIIIASLLMMWGCSEIEGFKKRETASAIVQDCSVLVDITFYEETHEYVFTMIGYGRSLSHWEGCKYCKQYKNE